MRTRTVVSIFLAAFVALSLTLLGPVNFVSAGGGGTGNTFDPNSMTQAEKQQLAKKNKMALDHVKTLTGGLSPNSVVTKTIWVGGVETYREPNTSHYVNFCVPSSTQVAIRAKTGSVPALDTVATGEYTDVNNGTDIHHVPPYINPYLNTTWYVTGKASSSSTLGNWLIADIDGNWSLMTLLDTRGMPGWVVDAYHYVATYGYSANAGSVSTVYFVDTSSELAGHKYSQGGSYFESASMGNFWGWVINHPHYGQVW